MKLYSEYQNASISMKDDEQLRKTLRKVVEEDKIKHLIETGTHHGLGSTSLIAESFPQDSPPELFVTIEANWTSWRKARRNLFRFSFVQPLWGKSVNTKEALNFIQNDDLLHNHKDYKDVFIDNVDDPVTFYSDEILGNLGIGRFKFIRSIGEMIDRVFHYKGQDLLKHYLIQFREKKPLVILDSAGGVGFLEFSILMDIMGSYPFLLLLDDIHHVKHYRSYTHVRSDPSFSMISVNEQAGWLLASHT
jgi:hypothetical protein